MELFQNAMEANHISSSHHPCGDNPEMEVVHQGCVLEWS